MRSNKKARWLLTSLLTAAKYLNGPPPRAAQALSPPPAAQAPAPWLAEHAGPPYMVTGSLTVADRTCPWRFSTRLRAEKELGQGCFQEEQSHGGERAGRWWGGQRRVPPVQNWATSRGEPG